MSEEKRRVKKVYKIRQAVNKRNFKMCNVSLLNTLFDVYLSPQKTCSLFCCSLSLSLSFFVFHSPDTSGFDFNSIATLLYHPTVCVVYLCMVTEIELHHREFRWMKKKKKKTMTNAKNVNGHLNFRFE